MGKTFKIRIMNSMNKKSKEQRESLSSKWFGQLAHSVTRFPLFSLGFQWFYLIIAVLIPLFFEDWTYSRFMLFFLFAALSIIPQSIRLLAKKKEVDYSRCIPKWYGIYLQKSASHPEIERSMAGAFVCFLFLGSLSSVMVLQVSIILCVLMLILMEWYLYHKAN